VVDNNDNDGDNNDESDDNNTVPVAATLAPVYVLGEVVGSHVVHDDVDDFVAQCVHRALHALAMGEEYELLPDLVEEEAMQVTIILNQEEEKRRFLGIEDTLAQSIEQLCDTSILYHYFIS
jgi:hypothetical protein